MTMESKTPARSVATGGITLDSIARYRQGAPIESTQFEFFIGDWEGAMRVRPPGGGAEIALPARWQARWVHDRRMLVDDLTFCAPDGSEIGGWLNLRTYCAETGAWEITGQRVLEPAVPTRTLGRFEDGEMHLRFETNDDEAVVCHHVRFFEITPAGFEWTWSLRRENDPNGWRTFAAFSARRAAQSTGETRLP